MDAHELSAKTEKTSNGKNIPVIPAIAQQCKMFVMTSPENHEETVQFFKENGYFGGLESSFVFFQQQMLPAVDT